MEIRSITFFCNPGFPVNRLLLQKAGIFARHAKATFEKEGFPVQTLRLATPPFQGYLSAANYVTGAQTLMFEAHGESFDYVSIGPALPDNPAAYEAIPEILAATKDVFAAGMTTNADGEMSLPAVRACAQIIKAASTISPDGFTNLRFSALANVPPFTPFFPAAYGQGWGPSFGLALEAADLAIEAFSCAKSLNEARQLLIEMIETNAGKLEAAAFQLSRIYNYEFKGLDFGLAPYPTAARSFGTALEKLGLTAFGLHGSLAASAFLTDTLDRAQFKRSGFNGLMLPVLEDFALGKRAAEGRYSLTDLLLCSSVCGTGLDVVPLPGQTSVEQLYAVLLDVSALALRLNKPLTARLMPLPGKKAGDATDFDFSYFVNSKVMPVHAEALTGLLGGAENILIKSRILKAN